MQPTVSQTCDECKLPIWKSDDGFYMVKVNKERMHERDFENNEIVTCDLNFHYYNMSKDDGELLQGYYVKLSMNKAEFETA